MNIVLFLLTLHTDLFRCIKVHEDKNKCWEEKCFFFCFRFDGKQTDVEQKHLPNGYIITPMCKFLMGAGIKERPL